MGRWLATLSLCFGINIINDLLTGAKEADKNAEQKQ